MSKKSKRVINYHDPLNDDFANTRIQGIKIDQNFPYIHRNFFWRFNASILYHLIAYPLIWFYMFVILGVRFKFENKKAVKKIKRQAFLYGNHTSYLDAFVPGLITAHRPCKIIVSPDTVSIKGIKNLVQMLGAFPVPSTPRATKNFLTGMETYHHQGFPFAIYPEAHIWPYYTGIRPFVATSFAYPVKFNAPVVAFVTTYAKSKNPLKKVQRTVWVSPPFYPDVTTDPKTARQKLRDQVYDWMVQTTQKYSTYAFIEYRAA